MPVIAPIEPNRPSTTDFVLVFIVLLGLGSSLYNIYKFADKAEAMNALWAGAALFALSILLATQLARMRRGTK